VLFDPERHERLRGGPWDEGAARAAIERIVRDAERRFAPDRHWPLAPLDADDASTAPAFDLYLGAAGVVWALHHLQRAGAAALQRSYAAYVDTLLPLNRAWLAAHGMAPADRASFLVGDTGLLLLSSAFDAKAAKADELAALIAGNVDHPARELMWGAPGTLLAALFLFERTGEPRWAELYRRTERVLWSQLAWSDEHRCAYWTQDLYGRQSTYLDAVHGFAGTALPLIRGRALLEPADWEAWRACIVRTVASTAVREGTQANWPAVLDVPPARQKRLMQFCHGAPGFVICLAGLPSDDLDDLLLAGGEATWAAGPLRKGANLCHGTGGNGYAFLKLFARTGDERWLDRARAFAMHGISQVAAHAAAYGQGRYSLWTGDPGFAVYLWDCVRGQGAFPTLDVFFPRREAAAAPRREAPAGS
jgi:hypothetical protein